MDAILEVHSLTKRFHGVVAIDNVTFTLERNKTTGKSFAVVPLPKARQAIIDAGGLIAYTRKRVMEAAKA